MDLPEDASRFQKNACFLALYASALLSSYSFDDYTDGIITFARAYNGKAASWALRALVFEREIGVLDWRPRLC